MESQESYTKIINEKKEADRVKSEAEAVRLEAESNRHTQIMTALLAMTQKLTDVCDKLNNFYSGNHVSQTLYCGKYYIPYIGIELSQVD